MPNWNSQTKSYTPVRKPETKALEAEARALSSRNPARRVSQRGANRTLLLLAAAWSLGACSMSPMRGEIRELDIFLDNQTHEAVQVSIGQGLGAHEVTIPPCQAVFGVAEPIWVGVEVTLDGVTLWEFDELPASDVRTLAVVAGSNGVNATHLTPDHVDDPPLGGRCP